MAGTNANATTLQAYEDHIQEYVDATPDQISGHVKAWIDQALAHTDKTSPVLELGSGTGRDASHIESLGYDVIRSDAAVGFVERLRSAGHEARIINALTDDLGGPSGMIFADAVFVHFTPDQVGLILNKVHQALTSGGILAFTVKQGLGSEWLSSKLNAPASSNIGKKTLSHSMLRAMVSTY
jgi:SAM-dependent methyltransferase